MLLATLLPAMLLSWRFVRENDAEIAAAVKTLASTANGVATDLEHRVQGTAQLHYGLAHSRLLDSPDRAACSAYLSKVREAYPQYTGILTVLPDGRLHCDSLQSGRDLNLSDRGYFKRVVAGAPGLVLEPVFGRLTGNSVLQVMFPARTDSGELRFMLVASLNLQKFAQEAQARARLPGSELVLLDAKGTVMAWAGAQGGRPAPGSAAGDSALFRWASTAASDASATSELADAAGQPQVWAMAASPWLQATGLKLLLGQPRQEVVAVSHLRLRQGLIVLSGAALLLFTGVWSLAEWGIRRQVSRITTMVRHLGAGDLGARIAPPFPRGELGGLMTVFNHTADSLQQQREAISELARQLRDAHGREITERQQNEARLSQMANFDSLTGLPNRNLFRDRLQQAIARSQRSARPFALLFLDIDRFKNINDSLGHDVGDRLLVAVAQVLLQVVRGTDSIGRDGESAPESGSPDGVFRLGGDEFTLLIEDLLDRESVVGVAQRILDSLNQPYTVGPHELFISGSIGITVYSDDSTDLDGLVKQADIAMYRAKALGRDTFCFFDPALNAVARQRHELEARLRHALERQEFLLHYQPKADLASGRVTGVEALLRWQPPGDGLIGPDQFIPALEETGLIVAVGGWVLREACGQMRRWQQEGMRPLQLAVNLSARQLRQPGLVELVAQALAETGLEAHRLEVELTESMLIDDSELVQVALTRLAGMGVRIAIDDFGTGHSSLRYLKRFQVDTLKIDRSFVMGTPADADDSAITAAVIALGQGMGLNVVAEGVETEAQRAFLQARQCHEWQGYLLSRAIGPDAFLRWLTAREASPGSTP